MAKGKDRYKRLFNVLTEMESQGGNFSISAIAEAAQNKRSAMAVYFRNKLKNVYAFSKDGITYQIKNLVAAGYASFSAHMSQKSSKVDEISLDDLLLAKGMESFMLAVEIYNKPLLQYKMESFLILMTNAWELVMKGVIARVEGDGSIFFDPKMERSISVSDCIGKLFPDSRNPVRRNLEDLVMLRDQAVHLVIPEVQNTLSRMFQSNVFNFIQFANKYAIHNPINLTNIGLVSLVSDVADLAADKIVLAYGKTRAERVIAFLESVKKNESELGSSQYCIPITYKFVLSNRDKEGDISLTLGKGGTATRVVEVPKDPDKTHPFLLKGLQKEVSERIGHAINRDGILSIVYAEKVQNDKVNKFHYRADNPTVHKYSPEFVDYIVEKLTQHADYFDNCRKKYHEREKRRKSKKV